MRSPRLYAALTAAALAAAPLAGCQSRDQPRGVPPPVDDSARSDTRSGRATPAPAPTPSERPRAGLSTGQKMVILGGAAAAYYLYRKHQNAQGEGEQGQYYLSKNGRVYYRDAEHRAHWVTPPAEGIPVPESEAQPYRQFQGYENRPTGRDLTGLGGDDTNPAY